MRSKLFITLTVLAFFSLMTLAPAQEVFGNISGTVNDSSGAAVANAKVTVTNTTTGTVVRTLTTNADGSYTAPSLPIGKYSVTAEAAGFSKTIVNNIELNVNEKLNISPTLKVGSAGEVMTVEAEPLQV